MNCAILHRMENDTYPRSVVLTDKKLTRLITEKADMVLEGRKLSEGIDAVQAEMEAIDKEVQAIESTVQVDDLRADAEELTKEFNAVMDKMEKNQQKVRERLLEIVPKELREKYDAKKKEKDSLELERNKIALKVQKWNDKIIPLGRKLMKPFIRNEYEDYDTLRLENGKVVATLFSHLADFKRSFEKRILRH